MGMDAPTDVITDTSTLVNFLRIGRFDLLSRDSPRTASS